MARRAVMKESSKWRSCRAVERVARTRPSARGGKMPQALAGHERIAAEDDGDVVMPSAEGASLVVVEPELSLEVFVDALGAPAFLGDPHELLSTGRLAQPRERVVGGGFFAVRPLDQQPVVTAIGVACVDLEHGEARPQRATTSLLPGGRAECAAWQRARQGLDRHGRRVGDCLRCTRHDRVGVDSDSVFEVEPPKAGTELSDVAVGGIHQRHLSPRSSSRPNGPKIESLFVVTESLLTEIAPDGSTFDFIDLRRLLHLRWRFANHQLKGQDGAVTSYKLAQLDIDHGPITSTLRYIGTDPESWIQTVSRVFPAKGVLSSIEPAAPRRGVQHGGPAGRGGS